MNLTIDMKLFPLEPVAYKARTAMRRAPNEAPNAKVFWAPLPVETRLVGVAVAVRFPAPVLETERVPTAVGMGRVEYTAAGVVVAGLLAGVPATRAAETVEVPVTVVKITWGTVR